MNSDPLLVGPKTRRIRRYIQGVNGCVPEFRKIQRTCVKSIAGTQPPPNGIIWRHHVESQTVAGSAICRWISMSSSTQAFASWMHLWTCRIFGTIRGYNLLVTGFRLSWRGLTPKKMGMVLSARRIFCGVGGKVSASQRRVKKG